MQERAVSCLLSVRDDSGCGIAAIAVSGRSFECQTHLFPDFTSRALADVGSAFGQGSNANRGALKPTCLAERAGDPPSVLGGVVVEEMLHLTLASNILNAIGGAPDLSPEQLVLGKSFPRPLPHAKDTS